MSRSSRVVTLLVAALCASCATRYSGDPFAGGGARSGSFAARSVQVAFEGECGICSVTLDVAGQIHHFVDTLVISRRYRVTPIPGEIVTMMAAPLGDLGPVRRIEIRISGEVVAEATTEASDGLPGVSGAQALSIQATIPPDR